MNCENCNIIEFPLPDLLDKISILKLKMERIGENSSIEEYNYLYNKIKSKIFKLDADEYIQKLYSINRIIWDLEAAIRQGKDDELGLEEIGRRALLIRGHNKIRITIKNEIVEKFGIGFKDVKVNHLSE